MPTVPEKGDRIVNAVTNEPPKPGEADTLKPSRERLERPERDRIGPGEPVKTQEEMLQDSSGPSSPSKSGSSNNTSTPLPAESIPTSEEPEKDDLQEEIDNWEPKPPKILRKNPNLIPLEARSQIQMYATTEYVVPCITH